MSLSLDLRPSLHQYSANKKENGDGVSTLYISKHRHAEHLYVTLLNELSAFGETFKQQIVNSSPPKMHFVERDITKFKLDTYI